MLKGVIPPDDGLPISINNRTNCLTLRTIVCKSICRCDGQLHSGNSHCFTNKLKIQDSNNCQVVGV